MHFSQIKKAGEDDKRLVWSEVYAPGIPDTDGEFMDAETILKAAYQFMIDLNLKKIDVQHDNNEVPGACVIESFIARKGDPDFIEGAWVVGIYVNNDEVWDKIKKGEINGFSMEALVTKQPVELEIEVPPVIHGRTSKDADHEHDFYVTYDAQGNFVGGRTNEAAGHFHEIRKGTVTEMKDDHRHRFSFVEHLACN